MKIGLLGTGNLAVALGTAWAAAGHSIVVSGRDADHAGAAVARIGPAAAVHDPAALATTADVIVVAVAWSGLEQAVALAGGPAGLLSGKTVIDCTNAVDFASGRLIPEKGSAAELVARTAPGAHVVKAFHLVAGATWPYTGEPAGSPVVPICGDDAGALQQVAALVADLGGRAGIVGGLDAARQLEDVAGFVMRLAGAGANPRYAMPDLS